MDEKLIRLQATVQGCSGDAGGALYIVRNRRGFVDAPLAMGGPNEEATPSELLLAAAAGEAIFAVEYVARQRGILIQSLRARSVAEVNPLGMIAEAASPALHSVRVELEIEGPTAAERACLELLLLVRCPILYALSLAVPVQVSIVPGAALNLPTH